MASLNGWRKVLAFGLVSAPLVAAWGHSNKFDTKLDELWKRYRNPTYGYCVSIPARWIRGPAFDGAGLYVKTGARKFSRPLGAIDFEAIASEPTDLNGDLRDHLAVLEKFERAERMETMERRTLKVQGSEALYSRHRYYDPQDRSTWAEEILLVKRNATVYRFELDCRDDQMERFAPVFERVMDSVEFDCGDEGVQISERN